MQPKYKVDEKVLCYHGPLLYEAKCTKFKKEGNSYTYLIHYQGKVNKSMDMAMAYKLMCIPNDATSLD